MPPGAVFQQPAKEQSGMCAQPALGAKFLLADHLETIPRALEGKCA